MFQVGHESSKILILDFLQKVTNTKEKNYFKESSFELKIRNSVKN